MSYKMIVLDIDGTLTNDEKKITPKTLDALKKAQESGIILVLASGRPVAGLGKLCQELEMEKHHGILLAYNGGKLLDAQSGRILYEKAIPLERAKAVLRHLEQFPVSPMVMKEKCLYVPNKDGYKADYESSINDLDIIEVGTLSEFLDFAPVKILTAAPNEVLSEHMEAMINPFTEEFSFAMSAPFYLECNMKGINKAASLDKACQELGIDASEIIAFGDAQNDISMVEYAGLGVAMGNACEELKAVANEITASNNEDGIAITLEKHLNIVVSQ